MSSFAILPLSRFAGSSAAIRRPKVRWVSCKSCTWLITSQEIACFSYDDEHVFHLDERSLRYYHPPNLGADLSKGFDSFRLLDDTADDHLDSLLKTIMDLEQRTGTECAAEVVTWRYFSFKAHPFTPKSSPLFELQNLRDFLPSFFPAPLSPSCHKHALTPVLSKGNDDQGSNECARWSKRN